MKFKLQSLNDVVTNSSMEVYQEATQSTVIAIQEIIDTILKISGSDKKCQDLFDITIDYGDMLWNYIDQEVDNAIREADEDSDYKKALIQIREASNTKQEDGHYLSSAAVYQMLVDADLVGESKLKTIEEFVEDYESWSGAHNVDTQVYIVPKGKHNAATVSTLNQINNLFTVTAEYNG